MDTKLPEKPKLGLYIDDSNLYYGAKNAGWKVDYKKLYKWVAQTNVIVYAKYFMGIPEWEPAKSINKVLANYYKSIGYEIIEKPLKRIGGRNKCNFDVEIHDEIMKDLKDLDIVYLASGDSDFMRTKKNILQAGKWIKFLAFKDYCAWEIRKSWYIFFDDIKEEVIKTSIASRGS